MEELLLLAGPTAAGKSEVALVLAEELGGEIVSVDSMQVYRGLDIGTAKPSREARTRVAHHLIDIVDLSSEFDAAQFSRLAHKAVADISGRGRLPILCGGTGLYFKAFLQGLGKAPPGDTALRRELEATPLADLLRELASRDPAMYERIDRQNPRRVIRAVEVIRLTGRPFSEQRARWENPACGAEQPANFFALARAKDDLRRRIDARVEAMFLGGLVAETERLLPGGLAQNKAAAQALGYRQTIEHLRGERPLPETIEQVKTATHQFAKRQMTWFRKQPNLEWIHLEPEQSPESAAAELRRRIRLRS